MKDPLKLLTRKELSLVRKRRRQRAWAAKARAANPEKHREAVRRYRKKLVARGCFKKGGKYYRGTYNSEKRKAYHRWYNANVRRKAMPSLQAMDAN